MQTLNVPYKGMNPTPDDYLCEDGLADTAVDLEMRSGGWHAMRQPKSAAFAVDGFLPRFIHHTSQGEAYVVGLAVSTEPSSGKTAYTLAAYTLATQKAVNVADAPTAASADSFAGFCAIGNIVNFTVDGTITHLRYIRGGYRTVQHVPPFVPIHFAAQRVKDNVPADYDNPMSELLPNGVECILGGVDYPYELPTQLREIDEFTEQELIDWYKTTDSYTDMSNACFGQHNSIRKRLLKDNILMYPVLLRYALKLYDGSYIQASSPILIFPVQQSTQCEAQLCLNNISYGKAVERVSWPDDLKYHFKSRSFNYECYKILFSNYNADETLAALQTLAEDYSDIVQSIDFFLSEELFTIDTSEMDVKTGVYLYYDKVTDANGLTKYEVSKKRRVCSPQFKTRSLKEAIEGVSAFYLVKSISVNDLKDYVKNNKPLFSDITTRTLENYTEYTKLDIESIYDGTDMWCNGLCAYNNRLLAYGIGANFPSLQRIAILTPSIENPEDTLPDEYTDTALYPKTATSVEVLVQDNSRDKDFVVRTTDTFRLPIFFFYPNAHATCFYALDDTGETDVVRAMKLTEHPVLNGTYYLFFGSATGDYEWGTDVSDSGYPDATPNAATLTYANQLKESEVSNPFVFRDGNTANCGSGKILALASTAQPTSTGQFGQFPLLAFCSDGVFAVGIASDGTLQTCSPYALDVVSAPKSVASVGGMVTFITPNGLVGLGSSGNRRVILPGGKTYPHFISAVQDLVKGQNLTLAPYDASAPDLHTYLTTGAQTAYDYTHNRLFLFNPAYAWTYVCDMDTLSWSVHTAQFTLALTEPDKCYLVGADGTTIWDYSSDDIREKQSGWMLTRPCKFGAHDVFKTVSAVAQRGYFGERDRDAVQQAIFGSENLFKWYPVRTSDTTHMRNFHGSPYKAFRVLALCKDWTQDLVLSAADLAVEGRMTDQTR